MALFGSEEHLFVDFHTGSIPEQKRLCLYSSATSINMSFSGALAPKKKSELQEIAEKMALDTTGTKDELTSRINKYMDEHEAHLSANPMFSGLLAHKRKPTRKDTNTSSLLNKVTGEEESPLAVVKRKPSGRRKQTPPQSPDSEEVPGTLTAPPSPIRKLITNVDNAISNAMPTSQDIVKVAEKTGFQLRKRAQGALGVSRKFMSNATNIASVTVLIEFLFMLYVMVPWQYYELPANKPGTSEPATFPLPSLTYLMSLHLYKQIAIWSFPTVIAPQIAGALISFTTPPKDIDPLSAGIVKLALAAILDDSWFAVQGRTISQWRVVGAATSLAFALAEATEERRVVMRADHH